ncbi:MAG: YbjN domain-containing protein [Scytonematopsis contorta HA4267-MV1]|jgi:hypothetical protein|nr:YbjN domain-containing protein [Scytonematopsis contorta HA4267-MV1]
MNEVTQIIDANFQPSLTEKLIFEEVIKFFKQEQLSFEQMRGVPIIKMSFQGHNGIWNCYASIRENQEQFIFYSICPVKAPENKLVAVAEFLIRANYGMAIGNFELNFDDGEICFKTSIDVEGDRLSYALIKKIFYTNVSMMDEYLPGFLSVIDDNVFPKDAITKIENT